MTTIPGILRLVKVIEQGLAENNNRRDDENDRNTVDDKDDDRSERDSACSGQSGAIEREQNGKNPEPKPRGNNTLVITANINNNSSDSRPLSSAKHDTDTCNSISVTEPSTHSNTVLSDDVLTALFTEAKSKATPPPSYSSSTTCSNASSLTASIHTSLHSALATRPDREIWLWPPHLPSQFCYRIMHWIYLKKLLPPSPFNQCHSLDMASFNPFMDLLLELNQLQHFQEYALLTAAAISHHSDMVSLCQYHEFSESHARRFLRRPLQEAMHRRWNEIVGPSPTNEALHRLLQTDRTGIVAGFLRGSSIGRGDGLF
ncbi:hypothetical protein BGZ98_009811 [Dissophora globulifera]|nr:hypothetical protein BGZ98_009811 [Dissophora globulifera]